MSVNPVAGKAASKASLKVLLHLMCVNLVAGKAASKASLNGTAKGVELDVKPSAPTSMPLRVRFGTGSPTGTVVNLMFAQDGTASRCTCPPPLLHLHFLLLLGSVCCLLFFSSCYWSRDHFLFLVCSGRHCFKVHSSSSSSPSFPSSSPGCVCLSIFFWSLITIASLLISVTDLPACLSNNPMFAEHATALSL